MGTQQDELLQAYQRELAWLRGEGAEFAAHYPKLAARLRLGASEVGDPHVERLIESFAFLTARVQHAFDSDLPELSTTLLGLLAPHLVEPLPSLSIACFEVDTAAGLPLAGHRIERGTQLLAEPRPGQTCRFRTCSPVTLWPLKVAEASLESPLSFSWLRTRRDVSAVLRLRLEARGAQLAELQLDRLQFFLDGPPEVAFRLYELLTCQARGVALAPDSAPDEPHLQPMDSLRQLGFGPEEAVLPSPPHLHRGYRLLQEYFAFPEKFLFFELALERACLQASQQALEVYVLLEGAPSEGLALTPETFRLGCTPIINLFPKLAEPVRLDQRRTEYPLVPDYRRPRELELHSILSVTAATEGAGSTREVDPLFSWSHGEDGEEPRAFWYTRRQPTGRAGGQGSQVLLSFVDLELDPHLPAEQTLHVHTLCTNGELPVQLAPGSALQVEERVPVGAIRCLRRPTPPREPPDKGPVLWQLVSLLSLNHLSLATGPRALEALEELLRLHDCSGGQVSVQQLQGLTGLESRPVVRQRGWEAWRGFCRGLEITLTFDESRYVGGSALLLAAVLHHFLGLYAPVDSFTQLVARSEQREDTWKRWPPMAGDAPLV
ncbi:type VI secretion system baseplate subunit TssF [Hyalangium minutum]|uniref:Protein ImpG/VasA n=1 Tax=Hyalangium minutum TaxID=394096 RepID=A0A085W9S5_9BACT|nr:type VI secretion system baseplate subunit TssF [Hyalangium minutum]KFE64438.1 Protein ImpG/VasA [Hyalangium minutum]